MNVLMMMKAIQSKKKLYDEAGAARDRWAQVPKRDDKKNKWSVFIL